MMRSERKWQAKFVQQYEELCPNLEKQMASLRAHFHQVADALDQVMSELLVYGRQQPMTLAHRAAVMVADKRANEKKKRKKKADYKDARRTRRSDVQMLAAAAREENPSKIFGVPAGETSELVPRKSSLMHPGLREPTALQEAERVLLNRGREADSWPEARDEDLRIIQKGFSQQHLRDELTKRKGKHRLGGAMGVNLQFFVEKAAELVGIDRGGKVTEDVHDSPPATLGLAHEDATSSSSSSSSCANETATVNATAFKGIVHDGDELSSQKQKHEPSTYQYPKEFSFMNDWHFRPHQHQLVQNHL